MADFTNITVTDNFGVGTTGSVVFTANAVMTNLATGGQTDRQAYEVKLVNGIMTAVLPATTDPTTSPAGTVYVVEELISGEPVESYTIQLPITPTSVVLGLLPHLELPLPLTYYSIQPVVGAGSLVVEQPYPLKIWMIKHNLGRYPFVSVTDENGYALSTTVVNISQSQLQLVFRRNATGKATLS